MPPLIKQAMTAESAPQKKAEKQIAPSCLRSSSKR